MNALVQKEIRQLLPIWIVALVLATVPIWVISWSLGNMGNGGEVDAICFTILCFGSLLLSLTPFGQEFSSGTFSQLLAQPAPRRSLWRVKILIYFTAAMVVLLAFVISYFLSSISFHRVYVGDSFFENLLSSVFIVLALFAGGLWTTLLLRQIAAAFWFTVLVPFALVLTVFETLIYVFRVPEPLPQWLLYALLVAYSAAGFFGARRMFLRAQDVQWTGGTITLPSWFAFKRHSTTAALDCRRTPLRTLIGKEIQFQHAALLIAAIVFVLHIASVIIRKLDPELMRSDRISSVILDLWFILWFALPFLLGSVAVAEERKLGTLENYLTLPVSRRLQFVVKFGVVIFLSLLFCAVIPWLIEGTGILSGVRGGPLGASFAPKELAMFSAFAAGIAILSFYASTLARNTLQALGMAVLMNCLAPALVSFNAISALSQDSVRLFIYIGVTVFFVTLLWLAAGNFRHVLVDQKLWLRNILILLIAFFVTWTATALIYQRSWELVLSLEPAHGPARLSGPVRPKIVEANGERVLALLPDGRLWTSTESKRKFAYRYSDREETKEAFVRIPLAGEFVDGSNWVSLDGGFSGVLALQNDGSLWQFTLDRTNYSNYSTPLRLERVGSDSDWKAIAAEFGTCLAVKRDGTLWGWGRNQSGQLGPGPDFFTNGPVRIGSDADWNKVFVSGGLSIGIKRDGSVWKWGQWFVGPDGEREAVTRPAVHREPVRWYQDGSDWIVRTGYIGEDIVLLRDGSLWASSDRYRRWKRNLERVGDKSWTDVLAANHLVGIETNGTLHDSEGEVQSIAFSRKPSKYSDWIAATAGFQNNTIALAADGTLSFWVHPPQRGALLAPSRKPLWSLNILTASTK